MCMLVTLALVVSPTVALGQNAATEVEAVQGLVSRLLGPRAVDQFDLDLISPDPSGHDVFQLLPTGSNG